MTEIAATRTILIDGFTRVDETVEQVSAGLSAAAATYQPDPQSNTIGWLVWHAARQQDAQIADLAGSEQVWPGWQERFELPFDPSETGYGQSPDEVTAVRADAELLVGYHAAVHRRTLDYLEGLTVTELDRIVDDRWDPPVSVAVRLVSIINDGTQHLGQAAYLRGLTDRLGL